jgi:peptidyl-prolyl cis-trans isomerase A (cyclophilin A)
MGPIVLTLDAAKAPASVKNFLAYVEAGFYDSTVFHRVIPGFMIQGGGFVAGTLGQKPTNPPIINESGNGLTNVRGSIAMARRADLNSATSQFFINLVDNPSLDKGQYAVFGSVTMGMDTVDKIAKVETGEIGGMENVPVKEVIIQSVQVNK